MNFFLGCLKGIAIGAGAIIPGLSSGVICVVLGIYEKLLDSALNLFKDFKNSIKFLLPIIMGGIIGMVIVGRILNYLFYLYHMQISFTFIGLIMGSVPSLIKQTEQKGNFKFYHVFYLLIALGIGILTVVLERNITVTSNTDFNFFYLVFSGMCMSIGVIVPGVSSTIILMLLGVYSAYLTSVAGVYLPVLVPIGIGLFIGSIICMKLIKILLERHYVETFYCIIGFTIGSVFVLYPGLTFDLNGIASIMCFLLGYFITNILEK